MGDNTGHGDAVGWPLKCWFHDDNVGWIVVCTTGHVGVVRWPVECWLCVWCGWWADRGSGGVKV